MGYNTVILILNDALGTLEENSKEFVEGIQNNMHNGGDIPVGNHANPAHVMPTAHADVYRLYMTQGNWINEFTEYFHEKDRLETNEDFQVKLKLERVKIAKDMLRRYEKLVRDELKKRKAEKKK